MSTEALRLHRRLPERPRSRPPAASRVLHNMSAPPRIVLTIRPLGHPEPGGEEEANRDCTAVRTAGTTCIGCLSVDRLVARTGRLEPKVLHPRQRLAGLVLLARAATGGRHATLATLTRHPREALLDELAERTAALDPHALGLPPFALMEDLGADRFLEVLSRLEDAAERAAMAQSRWPTRPGYPEIEDPGRALALLTRRSGRLFLARRAPNLHGLDGLTPLLAFHAPLSPPEARP